MISRSTDIRSALRSRQRGFIIDPYRFGAAAATGLLDSYTTSLWGAYGLVLLRGNYAGSAIRVRESGGNTEADIGFTGTALDTAALASHCGANSGFVVKWYDQSGGGNDLGQTTTTRQPRIVNAGTYDGKLVFNTSGLDDFLITTATGSSSVDSKSIFRKVNARAYDGGGVNIELEYGDGGLVGSGSGANQLQVNTTTATGQIPYMATNATGSQYLEALYSGRNSHGTPVGHVFRKNQSTTALSMLIYMDGSLQSATSDASGGSTTTGNFPAYVWSLGARASSANFGAQIDVWSCVIYDADKSADALAINALLA